MKKGETVTGRRVASFGEANDADTVCYWLERSFWYVSLPGVGVGNLERHTVTEHSDETITVSPSIFVYGHSEDEPTQAHGFLERGIWREV